MEGAVEGKLWSPEADDGRSKGFGMLVAWNLRILLGCFPVLGSIELSVMVKASGVDHLFKLFPLGGSDSATECDRPSSEAEEVKAAKAASFCWRNSKPVLFCSDPLAVLGWGVVGMPCSCGLNENARLLVVGNLGNADLLRLCRFLAELGNPFISIFFGELIKSLNASIRFSISSFVVSAMALFARLASNCICKSRTFRTCSSLSFSSDRIRAFRFASI